MPTKSTGTKSSAKRSKTSGLGRGISNLIPEAPTEENVVVKEVVKRSCKGSTSRN